MNPAIVTAEQQNPETGLDYFGARYFSGAQGRFTSPDTPLVFANPENPQTWNLYSYARNNPLKYVDPTGHDDVAAVGCGQDADCLKKLAEQRGKGAELLSGAAKGAVNGFITLSNAVNNVIDLAIAGTGLTDFRFGQTELLPMTSTEQAGSIMADVIVAGMTAGESLLGECGGNAGGNAGMRGHATKPPTPGGMRGNAGTCYQTSNSGNGTIIAGCSASSAGLHRHSGGRLPPPFRTAAGSSFS